MDSQSDRAEVRTLWRGQGREPIREAGVHQSSDGMTFTYDNKLDI